MTSINHFPFRDMMIGFDSFFDRADRLSNTMKYPPFNIEKVNEDQYIIELAVPGWYIEDIELEEHNGTLTVKGNKPADEEADYLYKGIASRAFTKEFKLSEHMKVKGAKIHNGILGIGIERDVPEELKPRKVEISSDSTASLLN